MTEERKRIRLQFEIYEDQLEMLERLMETLRIRTRTRLLNYCLSLAIWCVKERNNGRVIGSIDESTGKYKELDMEIRPS